MKFGMNFIMSVSKRIYTRVLKILCTFWLLNFYEVISNIYIYYYFEREEEFQTCTNTRNKQRKKRREYKERKNF